MSPGGLGGCSKRPKYHLGNRNQEKQIEFMLESIQNALIDLNTKIHMPSSVTALHSRSCILRLITFVS